MAAKPEWNNPDRWHVERGITVFAEHDRRQTRTDDDGKEHEHTIKFARKDLEAIAKNNNERDRLGNPCPLTLGHTNDDDDEEKQPDIVGYGRNFRVVYDRERKKHIVVCDAYLHPEDVERARKYPRPSVEVWKDAKFFDPIAFLKRTPQLDLGQWTYKRNGDAKVRYSMNEIGGDVRVRYAADDLRGEEDDDRDGIPNKDDADQDGDGILNEDDVDQDGDGVRDEDEGYDGPNGVPPEFAGHFMKCMKHHQLGKYGTGDGTGMGDRPGKSGTRKPKPAPVEESERFRKRGKPSEAGRMRKDSEALRFARLERAVQTLAKESRDAIAGLKEENRSLAYEKEAAVCERMVVELEPFYHLDRDVEVERMIPMNQEQRQRHLKYIKKNNRPIPVGGARDGDVRQAITSKPVRMSRSSSNGDVTVRGGSEGGGHVSDAEPLDDGETDQVLAYVRANKLHGESGWAEAVKAVRGGRS